MSHLSNLSNFVIESDFRIKYGILKGKHGGDRLKTTLGKFECPEKQTKFEGPAAIHKDMSINVAPPKCPENACPGKKCKMVQVMTIFVVPEDQIKYKPVCEGTFTQKRAQ